MTDAAPTLADVLAAIAALAERLDQPAQRYLGIEACAHYVGVDHKSIRRAIARGELTPLRPCRGRVVVDVREVDAWLAGTATVRLRRGRGMRNRVPIG